MRIVGGRHGGRDLTSPGGRVRPTAEEVRDRWLSWIAAELKGARVLELCAGTGAVGLEAISRGAKTADFVENNRSAIHSLKANIAALREKKFTRVFVKDAIQFASQLGPDAYDLVLADPPYGSGIGPRLIADWRELRYAPVFVLEHATDHKEIPNGARKLVLGDTSLTLFTLG